MAGGIQKCDGLAIDLHLIGADVLGDAAGLAAGHVGVADIVQQAGADGAGFWPVPELDVLV